MKIALLSLMFLLGTPTIEVEGVQFQRTLKSADQDLRLVGASGFTYTLIFDVLSGAIYLPAGTPLRRFSQSHRQSPRLELQAQLQLRGASRGHIQSLSTKYSRPWSKRSKRIYKRSTHSTKTFSRATVIG